MKIKRKELLNALDKIKPGIASKEIIESMTYFMFSKKNVITYNDKISIQHPLKTDFSLFVKANDFYKIISKLTSEEIDISEKNDKLNINSKTVKSSLATIEDSEIRDRVEAVSNSLKKSKWKELPSNFCSSLLLCSFTTSVQTSDGTLTNVYINKDTCIASDNNRVSYAIMDKKIDEMFVQSSEIKNLIGITPTKYMITKSWLHFKNDDDCIFSMRKTEGSFPNFLSFFDFEGLPINLPKEIINGIDITSILMDDDDSSMNFKISNNTVLLSAKSDGGKIIHRSKIKYNGDDINFVINPEFLKEMMKHSSSIILGKDKAKLTTDNFSLLTSLYG